MKKHLIFLATSIVCLTICFKGIYACALENDTKRWFIVTSSENLYRADRDGKFKNIGIAPQGSFVLGKKNERLRQDYLHTDKGGSVDITLFLCDEIWCGNPGLEDKLIPNQIHIPGSSKKGGSGGFARIIASDVNAKNDVKYFVQVYNPDNSTLGTYPLYTYYPEM